MDGAEPGRLLAGRYRLSEVIARGGMGVVWRAVDELLDRDVAVKEIIWPASFTTREQQTAHRRASREAQVTARLTHPNVIRVYDIVEEDGNPWIVMELLPYQSLRDRVQGEGPLTPAEAARVGLGILAALRAAHAEGIVHRDVKPANILVGPDDDRVVLTDFGIARAADSATLTTAGVLIGSPSYIAPERARGGPSAASGDLWGLGASLYAAVEGRPPFDRENALASLTAVVADEPDPPTHAGPLWPVIRGLLRKDPEARLTAAETEQLLHRVLAAPDRARPNQVPTVPTPADEAPVGLVSAPAPADEPPAPAEPAAPADIAPADSAVSEPARPAPASREPESAEPMPADPLPARPAEPVSSGPPHSPRQWLPRGRVAALVGVLALAVLAATATGVALALTGSPGHQAASPPASTRPGTSSSARPSAATTRAASSRPPASPTGSTTASPGGNAGNAGTGALPAGWHRFTNSTGFSIGVPQGWQISHVGHYVYITDPDNGGIYLLIDQSDQPKSNPLADWEQQQANRESSYPDYHLIRLESVDYPQAEKAADWEFTYDRNGVLVHILNRNVLANAHHAYALYWSTPEVDWNSYYRYFRAFAATFRPAPP